MAIVENDIIEIIDEQTYFNQQVLNRYLYRAGTVSESGVTPAEIGEAWWTAFGTTIRAAQNAAVNHLQVRVEVLTGARDYGQYVIPTGERTGTHSTSTNALAPFMAASVTLQGQTRATRPGGKRYVGGTEADTLDFGVLDGSYKTLVEAIAALIPDQIEVGGDDGAMLILPVLYRPASDLDPMVTNPIVATIVNPNISTQNTRKVGRGS